MSRKSCSTFPVKDMFQVKSKPNETARLALVIEKRNRAVDLVPSYLDSCALMHADRCQLIGKSVGEGGIAGIGHDDRRAVCREQGKKL
jgi:hypothetical protein